MTETQWERLHRLVELRRDILGLKLAGIQAVGGPSPKWVQKLKTTDGAPTARMRASMMDLDRALQWPVGTSWGLVADDRSGWTEAVLADEERQLLEVHDEVDHFVYAIAHRLRAIPAGQERDDVMRDILARLGIQP